MRLTPRGTGFLVTAGSAFVAAPLFSLPALQYVTSLLLGLVVLGALFVIVGHARIRVERSFKPGVVTPGTPARVHLQITNLRTIACLEARWNDTLPSALSGEAAGTLPALGGSHGPSARLEVDYPLHGLRRGRHSVGPLTVRVEDPFGLVQRERTVGGRDDVVVLPRRVDVTGSGLLSRDSDGSGRPAPQHFGLGTDDVIARTYLPGDALKRMHWKATAHRGELMVRQEEQEIDARAGIVLDTDDVSFGTTCDAKGRWDHSSELEWSISAAASVLTHLARQGHEVAVRAVGGERRRVADHGDTIDDVLVDLALLEPTTRTAVTRENVQTGEHTLVLLLGRLQADRAHAWVRAVAGADVKAFVAAGTRPPVLELLEDAGWDVVTYAGGDDVAQRWSELGAGGERHAAS
ncbi:DUF58 domain-containing protein [Aeromicrobium sp. CTD01-1L150]|uniref:DUF58 domain-containing protein n=1 Tax=Aeromicrobium sp. CTD01-1L150 TaxID=3341830 RepID=UPI0035C02CF9